MAVFVVSVIQWHFHGVKKEGWRARARPGNGVLGRTAARWWGSVLEGQHLTQAVQPLSRRQPGQEEKLPEGQASLVLPIIHRLWRSKPHAQWWGKVCPDWRKFGARGILACLLPLLTPASSGGVALLSCRWGGWGLFQTLMPAEPTFFPFPLKSLSLKACVGALPCCWALNDSCIGPPQHGSLLQLSPHGWPG